MRLKIGDLGSSSTSNSSTEPGAMRKGGVKTGRYRALTLPLNRAKMAPRSGALCRPSPIPETRPQGTRAPGGER